jgi:hypothetical protein
MAKEGATFTAARGWTKISAAWGVLAEMNSSSKQGRVLVVSGSSAGDTAKEAGAGSLAAGSAMLQTMGIRKELFRIAVQRTASATAEAHG